MGTKEDGLLNRFIELDSHVPERQTQFVDLPKVGPMYFLKGLVEVSQVQSRNFRDATSEPAIAARVRSAIHAVYCRTLEVRPAEGSPMINVHPVSLDTATAKI
jgi:hypothetical protein